MTSEAAAALRNCIDDNNLSQAEFGRRVGVTQSMVGQWLRNERPISVNSAIEIEHVFGLDAAVLSCVVYKLRSIRDRKQQAA